MYLCCLTVLGRDKKGIIKYKVGDREEKFYKATTLWSNKSKSLHGNNANLML